MTEEIDSIAPVGAPAATPSSLPQTSWGAAPVAPIRRTAPSGSQPPALPPPTEESLDESVRRINARLAGVNRVLQLRTDAETGITIAEIKNAATGQVLQQIPSNDIVHLAAMLSGWAHGKNVLVDLIA